MRKPLTRASDACVQDTVLRDDWGERNTKRRAPACFVLDVEALSIAPVPGQADDVSYGQPCWAPDGQLIMARCLPP